MYRIYTSTFIKSGKNPLSVSIAKGPPIWYVGEKYPPLYPSWHLIMEYQSKQISKDVYTMGYTTEVLNKLDPKTVIEDLNGRILLCWCKKGRFCHRHVVINWLKNYYPDLVTEEI